jgi:hypothetical protein
LRFSARQCYVVHGVFPRQRLTVCTSSLPQEHAYSYAIPNKNRKCSVLGGRVLG